MRNVCERNNLIAGLFALACLVIGMAAAGLGYAIAPLPEADVLRPPVYPADWMFWTIWLVLYPTMGIGAYYLWLCRQDPDQRMAWRLFLVGYGVNLSWVPIVHATGSPVAAPAVMDAVTGIAFLPALWAVARSNRVTLLWWMPLQVWGVITGTLKIWQLELNRGGFSADSWAVVSWAIYLGVAGMLVQVGLVVYGLGGRVVPRGERRAW